MKEPPKLIQTLTRAFAIIDCFSKNQPALTLNEISHQTQLNINTTRGLVQTLVFYGYLSYNKDDNLYRLGTVFLEKYRLADYDRTAEIIDLIEGDMLNLANDHQMSVRILLIRGTTVGTVHVVNPVHTRYFVSIQHNVYFPTYASSSGKLLLAHLNDSLLEQVTKSFEWIQYAKNTITTEDVLYEELDKIREQGFSYEDEELGNGFSSIAVPIFIDGELLYSLSATATTETFKENEEDALEKLLYMTDKISSMLTE